MVQNFVEQLNISIIRVSMNLLSKNNDEPFQIVENHVNPIGGCPILIKPKDGGEENGIQIMIFILKNIILIIVILKYKYLAMVLVKLIIHMKERKLETVNYLLLK